MTRLLYATASVVSQHDGIAELRLEAPSACGGCGARGACGGGQTRRVRIAVAPNVCAGDTVSLQLPQAQLKRGVLLAYLLPAATMVGSALLLAPGGDLPAVLGALAGLAFGLVCLRLLGRHAFGHGIRVCPPDSSQGEAS